MGLEHSTEYGFYNSASASLLLFSLSSWFYVVFDHRTPSIFCILICFLIGLYSFLSHKKDLSSFKSVSRLTVYLYESLPICFLCTYNSFSLLLIVVCVLVCMCIYIYAILPPLPFSVARISAYSSRNVNTGCQQGFTDQLFIAY